MAKKARGVNTKSGNGGTLILLMIALGAAMIYRPALLVLLVAGLVPTFVAWLTDSHPFRDYRIRIIFAFNVAGCLPYVVMLNKQSGGFLTALEMVSDFNSYLVMYGFAAVGWIIVFAAPTIAAMVLQMFAKGRISSIKSDQDEMIAEWGKSVAGMVDEEDEDEAGLVDEMSTGKKKK